MHRNVPKLSEPTKVLTQQPIAINDKGETMSKIKDKMEREHDFAMEQYYSFMEWVCDQELEVSKSDVANEDEKSSEEPSTPRTSIVHQKALNNIDYNPNRSIR